MLSNVIPADPKWLEILKASGWKTGALALAFVLFIVLVKKDIVSAESTLWITIPTLGALICGSLFFASIGEGIVKAVKPAARIDKWRRIRHDQTMVREFVPHMTDQDRAIIGYLLHHNQKMFQHEIDGGYAASLISKGIIRQALRAGQHFEPNWVPFEVPDHIWTVLIENRESFPYEPEYDGKVETHPWAIHWMVK